MFHYSSSFVVVSRPQAICRFLFNGPTKEGNELLLELTNQTKPVDNKVKDLPFDQFQTTGDWLVPRGCLYYSAKGSWVKGLNALFGCVYLFLFIILASFPLFSISVKLQNIYEEFILRITYS